MSWMNSALRLLLELFALSTGILFYVASCGVFDKNKIIRATNQTTAHWKRKGSLPTTRIRWKNNIISRSHLKLAFWNWSCETSRKGSIDAD